MTSRPRFDRPIAHRGLHDRARGVIENSRSAFEAAIASGYAIECDVQLSQDDVPVIFHDDDVGRLTGRPGPVAGFTAAVLTSMPLVGSAADDCPQRLADFLAQIAGRTLVQLELKPQRTRAAADALARGVTEALEAYAGEVYVESFDPRLLRLVRQHGCRRPLGIVVCALAEEELRRSTTIWQRMVLRNLLHWPWTRFGFISCDIGFLNWPVMRLFRALGMPVTAWTVRGSRDRTRALAGADQIVFEGFRPANG